MSLPLDETPSASILRRSIRRYERAILGLSGFVVVLVVWQAVIALGLAKTVFISSPLEIIEAAQLAIGEERFRGDVATSLATFLIGYGAAVVVGGAIGLIAGWSRTANDLVDPWISALYAMPDVALIPLIILWLGVGIATNSSIVFLAAVFSVTINVIAGVRSVDPDLLEVVRAFNAPQRTILRTIVLPTTLPFFLAGMRLASGRALVGVVVAEFVASSQGIGFMMSVAGSTLQTDRVMFGLVILGTFGMALGEVISRIERRFDSWRPQPSR